MKYSNFNLLISRDTYKFATIDVKEWWQLKVSTYTIFARKYHFPSNYEMDTWFFLESGEKVLCDVYNLSRAYRARIALSDLTKG